jgi:hypothetical protein
MNKISYFLLSIAVLGISYNAQSQFGFEYNDSLLVKVGGDTLQNPWAGGLNYPQFSDFDYDFDGDLDLFVFDRSKDNIRVYSQEDDGAGKYYKLVYNAKDLFPTDLRYRSTMVDYDNDGRNDLFTYGIGGLKVYRNVGSAVNGLQWELFKELVYSEYTNGYSNLNVGASDIPAIVDVDGDGDIDILTFHQGGRHVEYHQNQSVDNYGTPDSLEFVLMNQCWGKFTEDVNTNDITLNDQNVPCVGGDITNPEGGLLENKSGGAHSGSTLLALDYDNSGVLDLVIGDASFVNLNLLINGGTAVNTDSPMISVDPSFPSNTTPVNVQLFPAAFYLDVDFDGIKDLIVAPNAKNISFNENSVMFYKNTGSNTNPNFVYSMNDFLQNGMIEHGTGSIPTFFDYNEDGLKDLFVANFHRYKPILDKESTVAYYQNTGTANDPVYSFVDSDVFNFAQEAYGLRSVPCFGDLDDDGDDDMILGIENGTVVYYENNSVGAGAVFGTGVQNYTDNLGATITAGGFCHPQLFDLNNDGLLDLILGKRSGEIIYYKNIGTLTDPEFELINSTLGGIDVSTVTPDGYASPHFFRLNNETHLFLGSVDGNLIYYSDIDGNLDTGYFYLESTNYLNIDVEGYSSFWVEDVDDDSNLNLFVGQDLGGLYHFEANPNSNASISENSIEAMVAVYPNPVGESLTISVSTGDADHYSITNLNGKLIESKEMLSNVANVNTSDYSSGFYLIHIYLKDGRFCTKKIIRQ